MKRLMKLISRKKFRLILTPIFAIAIITAAIFGYRRAFAAMTYNLLTDNNGIRWQYGYDSSTRELEVSFYSASGSPQTITVPNKSYFINNGSGVTNGVTKYTFTNYAYHGYSDPGTFNSQVTKLDLSNVDVVNGVNPIVTTTRETEIILNPNGTEIGLDAFRNRIINIKNLDKVTKVGSGAFYNVTFKNTTIKLPNLTEIGNGSFERSNVMKLEINYQTTGVSTFKDCKALVTVKFLNNTTTIPPSAFEGAENLELVDFNNITSIGNNAFRYCSSFNQDLKDTKIESMGSGIFWGATGFTKPITMPSKVTIIQWRTFYGSNIKKINLNNVITINAQAFEDCLELEEIDFGKVESIQWKAFYGDKKLETITMSDTVDRIECQAFENCGLKSIDLKNVRSVQHRAFIGNNLEEVTLPKNIAYLSSHIFDDNPINKVTVEFDTVLEGSVSDRTCLWVVLGNTFEKVKEVEMIAPYGPNDPIRSYNNYTRSVGTISTSTGEVTSTIASYDNDSNYGKASTYKNVVDVRFLWNLPALETVIIGDGYEFLGGQQFERSPALKKVVLPETLKGIGCKTFEDSLLIEGSEINLPNSLEYIGGQAFFRSLNFENNIDLDNLRYIGINAFKFSGITGIKYCNKLQYIGLGHANFANHIKTIYIDCDYFNTNINKDNRNFRSTYDVYHEFDDITMTENVTTNPMSSTFYSVRANTINLENMNFTNSENQVSCLFQETIAGTLKLPKKLKIIGSCWFYLARIEEPLELPNTITRIEYNGFFGTNVRIDSLPNKLEYIGSTAFWDCDFSPDIVIPSTVTYIGYGAFTPAFNTYYRSSDSTNVSFHQTIYRHSVTILCPLTPPTTNSNPLRIIFANNVIDELIFGNNVTELPTNKLNNGITPQDGSSEFFRMNVRKVTFKNLRVLPMNAFLYCNELEEVDFSKDTALTKIDKNAFINTPSLTKVKLPKNINLTIESHAFTLSGLQSIGDENSSLDVKNNNITIAGEGAFQYNNHLKKVELSSSFNNGIIPEATFADCYILDTVILDDTIQEIKADAFKNGTVKHPSMNVNFDINNTFNGGAYEQNVGYSDKQDYAFVMYGNTTIDNPSLPSSVSFTKEDTRNLYIACSNLDYSSSTWNFTVQKNGSSTTYSNSSLSYQNQSNLGDSVYYMNYSSTQGDNITVTVSNSNYYVSKVDNIVWILSKDNHKTIYYLYDLYCYQNNSKCQNYRNSNSGFNNTSLYYLDEIVHIDTNKRNVEMNSTNTDIDKTGLVLYALRRDGVLLVSNEQGRYKEAVKYAESDITLPTYNPTNVDQANRVFNTTRNINDLNVRNSENFTNVSYTVGEEDPDTGRIYVALNYPNIVGNNTVVTNVLKTKGTYADVIYSDGCDGESFGLFTYNDILVGGETPQYEGIPTRPGYEFIGWDKEISDTATEDIVYVAQWRKIEEPDDEEDDYDDPMPDEGPNIINPETGRNLLILTPFVVLIVGSIKIFRKRKKLKA